MNNVFHSSTRGKMRASGVTKALMAALRSATFEHTHTDSVDTAKRLSEARAEIVEYITRLEDDLNTHRAQWAEKQRREYERAQAFSPRRYQKDALDFIEKYSYRGSLSDWLAQGKTSRVFGEPAAAAVFMGFDRAREGSDYSVFTRRPAWRETNKVLTIDFETIEKRIYAHLAERIREQTIVLQGIA